MIGKRANALTEAQRLDWHRRRDTCSGVQVAVLPLFLKWEALTRALRTHRDRGDKRTYWFIAAWALGGLVVWWGRSEASTGSVNFGWLVIAYAFLWLCLTHWQVWQLNEKLELNRTAVDLLLAAWIGAGGRDSTFWEFRDLVDAELEGIDFDSDRYKTWWQDRELDLLESVDGKSRYELMLS